MTNIAVASAIGKGWRRPDAATLPTHSDRLRALALRVERLGVTGRTDPERILIEKLTVAGELRQLAMAIRP